MNICTIIVDDEALARNRIRNLLAAEPDISVIGECATGREAMSMIQEASPDLLFLDIQMPEVTGFDVLKAIPVDRMPIIIFVTAYDQHALKAFEVHALDYLLKPCLHDRFRKALERARTHWTNRRTHSTEPGLEALLKELRAEHNYLSRFMVKSYNRVLFIKPNEVDWIESASNYALLHVGDKTHIVRETMQALENKLDPKAFQRISRSAIVNLERVKELQPMGKGQYVLILTNGKQLTMTRGIRDLQLAFDPY